MGNAQRRTEASKIHADYKAGKITAIPDGTPEPWAVALNPQARKSATTDKLQAPGQKIAEKKAADAAQSRETSAGTETTVSIAPGQHLPSPSPEADHKIKK